MKFSYRNGLRFTVALLLPLLFFFGIPNRTYAVLGFGDISFDPAQDVEGALTTVTTGADAGVNAIHTGLSASQWAKTFVLDPLANALAKQIIRKMTVQTVNWINSGFKGNPAYVTNPDQFFLDVGDRVASQFLTNNKYLNNLCSPFKAQVRLALVNNYLNKQNNQACTIDKVVRNYDSFVQNFDNGGWEGWIAVTQNQQNNPYGAYIAAQNQLNISIGNEKNKYQKQLDWGQGVLSFEKCTKRATAADSSQYFSKAEGGSADVQDGTCLASETVTPGSVISDQMKSVIKSPQTQLELTNGINQVVSALMMQMVQQVVGGIGSGLRGLTQSSGSSSNGSSRTLLEQMAQGSPETQKEDAAIQQGITDVKNDAIPDPSTTKITLPSEEEIKAKQKAEREGALAPSASGETHQACVDRITNNNPYATSGELSQSIQSECVAAF
jgi:hypothetical protein